MRSLLTLPLLVASAWTQRTEWGTEYDPDWHFPQPPPGLSPLQHSWIVNSEQKNELPILNPRQLDPSLLMVCDDLLTPDDIYTGLMSVMVRVEDTLRRRGCDPRSFAVHRFPTTVHTLLGHLSRMPVRPLRRHPVLGTYLDTMAARTRELLAKAEQCQLDYVLLMKLVRMSMKLLVNRIMCGFVEIDVLRNRFGWPKKYGSRLGAKQRGSAQNIGAGFAPGPNDLAPAPYAPYYDGPRYPFTRRPITYPGGPPMRPWSYYAPPPPPPSTSRAVSPQARWPYYPAEYAPQNPLLGSVGPDGHQLNGIDAQCSDCDRNRNVLLP